MAWLGKRSARSVHVRSCSDCAVPSAHVAVAGAVGALPAAEAEGVAAAARASVAHQQHTLTMLMPNLSSTLRLANDTTVSRRNTLSY